jgi:hypothetical protein
MYTKIQMSGEKTETSFGESLVHILAYSNNSVNFIFYGLFSQKYRQAFSSLFIKSTKNNKFTNSLNRANTARASFLSSTKSANGLKRTNANKLKGRAKKGGPEKQELTDSSFRLNSPVGSSLAIDSASKPMSTTNQSERLNNSNDSISIQYVSQVGKKNRVSFNFADSV